MVKEYNIIIKGLVQGVGFRPFIYRIADEMNLNGTVENRLDGVAVVLQADEKEKNVFINKIHISKPAVSKVTSINIVEKEVTTKLQGFSIKQSNFNGGDITQISPDIAVCDSCLMDMKTQPHRLDYPFITCAYCGPRFTIIQSLPYDRCYTTMHEFTMCKKCYKEYSNILDRRFHAQPIACSSCGPIYFTNSTKSLPKILDEIDERISNSDVVAIKGLGGYNLICDAFNESAVLKLRNIKHREGKPFAVMFKSLEAAKEYCYISDVEEKELLSWRRPIVLLNQIKDINKHINLNLNTLGVILPYTPIHYMIFEKLSTTSCIVFTSGNTSGKPLASTLKDAEQYFRSSINLIIHNNRDIYNKNDDSVIQVNNNTPFIIRRSRGYVPTPINTPFTTEGFIGFGAELTNSFGIGSKNNVILSQHIGDLQNFETFEFYKQEINKFLNLFKVYPTVLACDKHPNYYSTIFAKELSKKYDIPLFEVQHHHAHAAAVIAENNIEDKVIAITLDGTGLGDDGNIWGGEILFCDYYSYKRLDHLDYVAMPGGDRASEEGWRMAISYIQKYFSENKNFRDFLLNRYSKYNPELIINMINKKINSPLTSSAGRLFDAVASIIGICDIPTFHAEGPIRLESVADRQELGSYPFDNGTLSIYKAMENIIAESINGISPSTISARFHNTLASMLASAVDKNLEMYGLSKVVLAGGTFQNRLLTNKLITLLKQKKIAVYMPHQTPINDAGIALGQIAIASHKYEQYA